MRFTGLGLGLGSAVSNYLSMSISFPGFRALRDWAVVFFRFRVQGLCSWDLRFSLGSGV